MKSKIPLFVACLVALLALQSKVILPFMLDVASSGLFLKESDDLASNLPISNVITDAAFIQCNKNIKESLSEDSRTSFANQPINAWTLGDYLYVIHGEFELTNKDVTNAMRRYACRIKYAKGKDTTDINNPDNWSIEGIGLSN